MKEMELIVLTVMVSLAAARSPTTCCDRGFSAGSKALTESTNCTPSDLDTVGFGGFQKTMCLSFYTSCCQTTAKVMFCQMGKQLAVARQSCAGSSDEFFKTRQTCCHCCKLGQQEALRGGECSSQTGDDHCKEAFAECCSYVKSSVQPTTSPPARRTCKNIECDPQTTAGCADEAEGPACQCKPGFLSTKTQLACSDIDECTINTHTCSERQVCKNTHGAFLCIDNDCSTGFSLKDGKCVDDDECLSGTHRCGQNNFCLNSPGTYSCLSRCPTPNYQVTGNNVCVDVNECAISSTACPNNFRCINHVGSYSCERVKCDEGYRLVKKQCIDIDECSEQPNICGDGGTCFNSYGRYYCKCKTGYQVDSITKKCVDTDECANSRALCSHQCENMVGSYTCLCPDGYDLQGSFCYDKDECKSNPCGVGEYCFNSFGSFACINQSCPDKYFLQASYNHCRKTECFEDETCEVIPEQSIKWAAFRMLKTVRPNDFRFRYTLTGYPTDYQFHYYFDSGNDQDVFYIQLVSRDNVQIVNIKSIEGPQTYTLHFHSDVFHNGELKDRFVYIFYIFVSGYNFN